MTTEIARLPEPNPEQRRIATERFERANQVIATGDYDYGIQLLMTCCKIEPSNLIYRQTLRRTQKAKFKNNMRGSRFAMFSTSASKARIKAARHSSDFLKVLEQGAGEILGSLTGLWVYAVAAGTGVVSRIGIYRKSMRS